MAGATYPPLTAAIRGAWNDLTEPGSGRHHLRDAALAAETSLFELVFVLGPMLVAGFVLVADPAAAHASAPPSLTLVGTLVVARGRRCAAGARTPPTTHPRASARCGSAASRRCWSASPAWARRSARPA